MHSMTSESLTLSTCALLGALHVLHDSNAADIGEHVHLIACQVLWHTTTSLPHVYQQHMRLTGVILLTATVCGRAGVIQADAFISNQLHVAPLMMTLPSEIRQPTNVTLQLQWQGQPLNTTTFMAVYDIEHVPAVSITLNNGWYGTNASIQYVYRAAQMVPSMSAVAINTKTHEVRNLQVG